MAGDFCTIIPTVNKKRSRLFQDIENYVGKENRYLTVMLYAITLDKNFRKKFSKNDFNSQGEIVFAKFKEKARLDSILSALKLVNNERKSIGAVDASGNPIAYDNPNLIKDRVLDYNDNHSEYHAKIVSKGGKYFIDLDVTDASNFKSNVIIRDLDARFNAMNSYLNSLGFHVNWSEDLANKVANFRTYKGFRNIITSFKADRGGVKNMSVLKSQVLIELMNSKPAYAPIIQRLVSKFGDDTAEAFSKVSAGEHLEIPDAEYWEGMINNIRNSAQTEFRKFDIDTLAEKESKKVEGIPENSEEFFGIGLQSIEDSINDLDYRFHIKQKYLTTANNRINSLSEAAKELYVAALRIREDKLRKKEKTKKFDSMIAVNERFLNSENYIQAISGFLTSVYKTFENLQKTIDDTKKKSETFTSELSVINEYSSKVLEALSYVKAYKSVVQELSHIEDMELDQVDIPEDIFKDVKNAANGLLRVIDDVESQSRKTQLALVKMFLQKYWGSEDVKIINGVQRSFSQIIDTLSHDVGFAERMLLSMNESSDEALGLFYEAVKANNRERDGVLRKTDFIIRVLTDDLYKKGKNTESLFIKDKNGVFQYMKSEVDYYKYMQDKAAYRKKLYDDGVRGAKLTDAMVEWENNNTEERLPFSGENLSLFKKYIKEYIKEIYDVEVDPEDYISKARMPKTSIYGIKTPQTLGLDSSVRDYYIKMLALRQIVSNGIPFAENDLFSTIQVTKTFNLQELWNNAEDIFSNLYTNKEDGEEDTFEDMLMGNHIKVVATNLDGSELMRIPIFFTHKLADAKTVSTNFSQAMSAFTASAVNYTTMSDVIDVLVLAQDYLTTERGFEKGNGPFGLINMLGFKKNKVFTPVKEDIVKSKSAEQLEKFSLGNLYNQRKERLGDINVAGKPVSIDSMIDSLTGATSVLGLTTNLLGAEANLMVGHIQMFIEAKCKEFYTLANFFKADVQYAELLPELLGEVSSNNKKSLLALLGERFNVMDDFFETLKEQGFKSTDIGRILNNNELMFLYGAGEHLLHHQTMLAILDSVKIYDTQTSQEVPLFKLFSVRKEGANGILEENRARYKWIIRDSEGKRTDVREITDEDINKVEKQITYCNKSMHGAFGSIDKGMIHRYAIGRLFMNFRQWMPAHYARRFNKPHYDADLGEYRSGYYYSLLTFVFNAARGLIVNKTAIATSWETLSEMDKYNVKRAIAEVETLVVLTVSLFGLGDYKDKKGNWAYRNLMYELKRMLLEVQASTPVFIPGLNDPLAFVNNIITIMNSPFAALNTIEKIADTLNAFDLFYRIEGGKYKGENKWMHNFRKNAPFVGQITKQVNIKDSDDMFKVFERAF